MYADVGFDEVGVGKSPSVGGVNGVYEVGLVAEEFEDYLCAFDRE